MKANLNSILVLMIVCIFWAGCKKFVEIDPPNTNLVTASVFSTSAAATSAQLAIYSKMASNGESENMAVNLGLLSDELTNYNKSSTLFFQYYRNAMTATLAPGPWTNAYNYIYQENAIISALQGNSSLATDVISQLLGEAKFTRAFWFFYLTNLYGDIPLVTSTDYTLNATISRSPRAEVYQQIVSDLKNAQSLMNVNYVDATDTAIATGDRTRPNKWTAAALLARVYLYTGDYVDAGIEADSIVNSGMYSLGSLNYGLSNYVFKVGSPEAIWQLGIPLPTNYNTPDGADFILISEPGPNSVCCSIAPQLINSFESGDTRRSNWIDSFQTATLPVKTYYYPFKYHVRQATTVTEDIMVFRLAEQYLIKAEAEAKQGDITNAINDLNVIRNRAALSNYGGGTDQQSVLTAILHERQVELFTEWGHRWLDLIRTGSADSVMGQVTPFKGGTWSTDDHQFLFPISQSERTLDLDLTQNAGY